MGRFAHKSSCLDLRIHQQATNNSNSQATVKRKWLQVLRLRLALSRDKLPSSIFVRIEDTSQSLAVEGGAHADIFKREHKGKPVALKRLRTFKSLMGPDVRKVKVAYAMRCLQCY